MYFLENIFQQHIPNQEESNNINQSKNILESFLKDEKFISKTYKDKILYDLLDGFGKTQRRDESMYVEHLIATYNYAKKYLWDRFNESIALAALLHDAIEDSNMTFEYINKRYWTNVAIYVELLTKPSLREIHERVNLNDNHFRHIILGGYINKTLVREWEYDPNNIQQEQELKKIRDHHYFSKFATQNWLSMRFKKVIRKYSIHEVSDEQETIEIVAVLKLCDRLHNISTLPLDTEKTQKKYQESNTWLGNLQKIFSICKPIWQDIEQAMNIHSQKMNALLCKKRTGTILSSS
jgi:(p)ppGpp synthase/HD superfamily hydrolase